MIDFIKEHGWDLLSAAVGFVSGGTIGSLITVKIVRGQNAAGGGNNVNQARARSRGDIVAGNKTTTTGQSSTRNN